MYKLINAGSIDYRIFPREHLDGGYTRVSSLASVQKTNKLLTEFQTQY